MLFLVLLTHASASDGKSEVDLLPTLQRILENEPPMKSGPSLGETERSTLQYILARNSNTEAKIDAVWALWLDGVSLSEIELAWWTLDNRYREVRALIVAIFNCRSEPTSATVSFGLFAKRFEPTEAEARRDEIASVYREGKQIAVALVEAVRKQRRYATSDRLNTLEQMYSAAATFGIRDR